MKHRRQNYKTIFEKKNLTECRKEINWIFFFSLVDYQLSAPSAGKMNKNLLVYRTGGKSIFQHFFITLCFFSLSLSLSLPHFWPITLSKIFSSIHKNHLYIFLSITLTRYHLFSTHPTTNKPFFTDPFFLSFLNWLLIN